MTSPLDGVPLAASAKPPVTVTESQLANCAREPIHIPGSIQPHGALIAFEPGGGTVLHASDNLGRWLQTGELPVRGRSLVDLLGEAGHALVMRALAARGGSVRHHALDLPARPSDGQPVPLQAVVHVHRGACILELEPLEPHESGHDWMQTLADAIEGLRSANDLGALVERTAQRVKRLTRFDRVMVYTFDAQADGHVIADAREPDMESFYDLHYPASDIPAQARELYLTNLVRYLADADATPSPVLPWLDGERLQPLDMSHAMLRSMSPVHLQYLRNMGVASTLTLSILVDGRLWGLIACHHRTPTRLSIRMRRACHALAVSAGYMVGWNVQQQQAAERADAARLRDRIVEAFNQVGLSLVDVIEQSGTDLARIVGASGGAFWRDDQVLSFGQWPAGARGSSILRHVRHAFETSAVDLIHDEAARLEPPLQPAEARQVAGVLAIRLDGFSASGIVWVRPEHRREVAWGGDPSKPADIELDEHGQPRLSPRSSFARWEVAVRGRSRPWSEADREAARSLQMLRQIMTVRESLAQVSLSDREFRSLVALQSDTYWQLDAQARVTTLSKPLPTDHGEVAGRSLPELFDPSCEPERLELLRQSLQAQLPFRGLRLHSRSTHSGRRYELVLNGEPRRDAAGRVIGWHGTVSDVSGEARVQAALREKQAADLANLAKSRFLSQISHELRTPLNAVLGFSQLLLADKGLAGKHRGQVEHINRAGSWLLTMISDLMDLSAIETGKLRLHMGPVDARAVIAESVQYLYRQGLDAGIRIAGDGGDQPRWVRADATRLQQVLVNLVSNALKYNRPHGEVRVVLRLDDASGRTHIEVHDTGMGLTADQRAQLFTPFNRLGREAQNIQGTGIGLVISKQIVEAMDGQITVDSVVGQGSCFAVCLDTALPLTGPDRAGPPSSATRPPPRRTRTQPVVLYVEDDPVNVIIMQSIVEAIPGLRFAHAGTAEDGLDAARTLLPTVLLIDINLPARPGTWLVGQVAADATLQGTPCVAVTADATDDSVRSLRAAGFVECFRKPIDLRIVSDWLKAVVAS